MSLFVAGLLLGLFCGAIVGVFVASLCVAAKWGDEALTSDADTYAELPY